MIHKAAGERALDYVCKLLQDSGNYEIGARTHRLAEVVEQPYQNPKPYTILVANAYRSREQFQDAVAREQARERHVAPLLYKDGKTAFVRLLDRTNIRRDGSLRRYSEDELQKTLWLRDLEDTVLTLCSNPVAYYQPPTGRLEEGIRLFELKDVTHNYDHLQPGDKGYQKARSGRSLTRKIAVERGRIAPAAELVPSINSMAIFRSAVPKAAAAQRELEEMAQGYFPGLDAGDALRALQGEAF